MIYSQGAKDCKTLTDLLNWGFSERNGMFVATYKDPQLTQYQCGSNRRRSFTELLEIAQTYLPNTTKEQLAYELTIGRYTCAGCCDIHKLVFRKRIELSDNTDHQLHFINFWSCFTKDEPDINGVSYNDVILMAEQYKKQLKECDTLKEVS
jgi:hypothetical protein